jgi:hypothetical protein
MKQTKRITPYKGHDSAEFVHNNKMHRTSGDAFRDANYANPIYRDEEMSDMKIFCLEMLFIVVPILAVVIYAVILLLRSYK